MSTKKASKRDKISHGFMETALVLPSSGLLTGTTRTCSEAKLWGFTGSVQVIIYTPEKDGFITNRIAYGVNGKSMKTAASDRTDVWQIRVPTNIAQKADEVAIIHSHDPKFNFFRLIDDIKKGTKTIASAYQELKPIIVALK